MKRTSYLIPDIYVTVSDVNSVEDYMSREESIDMKRKINNIMSDLLALHSATKEEAAYYEKLIKLGYLLAHTKFEVSE